jgi:hypothetical protein
MNQKMTKKAQREKAKEQQKSNRRKYFKDCTEAKVRRTLKSSGLAGVHQMVDQARQKNDDPLASRIKEVLKKISRENSLLSEKTRV